MISSTQKISGKTITFYDPSYKYPSQSHSSCQTDIWTEIDVAIVQFERKATTIGSNRSGIVFECGWKCIYKSVDLSVKRWASNRPTTTILLWNGPRRGRPNERNYHARLYEVSEISVNTSQSYVTLFSLIHDFRFRYMVLLCIKYLYDMDHVSRYVINLKKFRQSYYVNGITLDSGLRQCVFATKEAWANMFNSEGSFQITSLFFHPQ